MKKLKGMPAHKFEKLVMDFVQPKYYALQNKEGHLFTTINGKVMVCTHKLKEKGYKCVELVVKEK